MKKNVGELEERRLKIQAGLDAAGEQTERNRLGQFATPTGLAVEMLRQAREYLNDTAKVRFIDPAMGTGAFYSALLETFPKERLTSAVGYEIDSRYGNPAAELWGKTGLDVRMADFTLAEPPAAETEKFNLLVCNPPYVRHHHIPNG